MSKPSEYLAEEQGFFIDEKRIPNVFDPLAMDVFFKSGLNTRNRFL
jgi:hypothetical protein